MEIKKILVPIDFSKCSINALKIAADIAQQQRASLEVINAIQLPSHPHTELNAIDLVIQPMLSEYEKRVEEQFEKLLHELPILKEVDYTTHKIIAPTANAVSSCLEKEDIDLIVMGTKGSHDRLEKLVGSVSSDIIKCSKVPVLMIPENINSFNIRRIGFAADLHKIEDIKKLEVLVLFAKILCAEIKIFHLSSERDERSLIEEAREKMNLLASLSEVKHTYTWVNSDELLEGVFDFIESHQIDMLVMYPRQHRFWDRMFHVSVTKKVAVRIEIPLLTIHE